MLITPRCSAAILQLSKPSERMREPFWAGRGNQKWRFLCTQHGFPFLHLLSSSDTGHKNVCAGLVFLNTLLLLVTKNKTEQTQIIFFFLKKKKS